MNRPKRSAPQSRQVATMQRYVAFLRGINLGKRRLPMSRLRDLFQGLGFAKVETFIASGNVLFSTTKQEGIALEGRIAAHLEQALGYRVDTFVRTVQDVAAITQATVFKGEKDLNATVYVGFLQQELPPESARRLAAVRTEVDEFQVRGREIYWLCRIRSSDSKVWSTPEIKALRLPTSTMRNMSSIRKLIDAHNR